MNYGVPERRRILELEGLRRRWVRPHLEAYADLFEAGDDQQVPAR